MATTKEMTSQEDSSLFATEGRACPLSEQGALATKFLSTPFFRSGKDAEFVVDRDNSRKEKQCKNELDWSLVKKGKLYARDREMRELRKAFESRITPCNDRGRPELVLVSGHSGTGKTVLVRKALQDLVEEHDGYFIAGKFDQLQTPDPFGPFVAALTQLVINMEQTNFQSMDSLQNHILNQVGTESCHVLCTFVPALRRFLHLNEVSTETALGVQQERLRVALKKFLKAICSSKQPLCIVLDDLQWADMASLGLLETLVKDEIMGLVLIGICRSNEVPWHHTFASMLRRLEDDVGARIIHVEVMHLPLDATNALISDLLCQPQKLCRPLSEIIHAKSSGNVFNTLQILRALHTEGVLAVGKANGTEAYEWMWHDDEWEKIQNLDIVDLVSYQIKRLPEDCQRLLKMAACIGAEFDERSISTLMESSIAKVKELLGVALKEQMVVAQIHRPGKYSFAHDRIQQAAYSLIPEQELAMTHLTIGRTLLHTFNKDDLQNNLFLVVNQLIMGIPLLTAEIDKHGLAELCLQAGKKATKASDFDTGRKYFSTGINLLSRRHWRDEYDLSLNLYNCKAEVEAACGDIEATEATIHEIQLNCRSCPDKLISHLIWINSLGARARFDEAIGLGLQLMENAGERFPSKPRLIYLIVALLKVKKLLRKKSDFDLLNLPEMDKDDRKIMTSMKVLQTLCLYMFCGNPKYFPFAILKMMRLTLKHGYSDMTAVTFANYGMILCAIDEFDEGYRYAKLALRLLDRDPIARMQWGAKVSFVVHGCISPWQTSIRSATDALKTGIVVAAATADFECLVYTAYSSMINVYLGGDPLSAAEGAYHQYIDFLVHYKQGPWLSLANLLIRFLAILEGEADGPLNLRPDDVDGQAKFNFQLLEATLMTHRVVLAYHLGDTEGAVACAKVIRIAEKANKGICMILFHYLYDGLASFEAAYHGNRRHHMAQGRKAMKKLEFLAKQTPVNGKHKLLLLRGEVQALRGNLAKALEFYSMASEEAGKSGVLQLQALAHERSGIACQRCGKDMQQEAESKLRQAVKIYEAWGGIAIVEYLKQKHGLHGKESSGGRSL